MGANSSIKDRAIIAPTSAGSVVIGSNVIIGQVALGEQKMLLAMLACCATATWRLG